MFNDQDYRRKVYDTYTSVSGLNTYLPSKYQSLVQNLRPHLQAHAGKGRLLDIGSGQGELLTLCRDLGFEAEWVDISRELAESCRARGLKVALTSDLFVFLKNCVNDKVVVTLIDVLEHFTKAEAIELLGIIRSHVLQPGGKVVIQVPNMQNPFAALNFFHDVTHEWAYTEHSISQLLGNAGFKEVKVLPSDYPMTGVYVVRHWLHKLYYVCLRGILLIDQPNRSNILTPNLIAVG